MLWNYLLCYMIYRHKSPSFQWYIFNQDSIISYIAFFAYFAVEIIINNWVNIPVFYRQRRFLHVAFDLHFV